MQFFPPFFAKKKPAQPAASPLASETVSLEILKELIPIRSLKIETLQAFAVDHVLEAFPEQTLLFKSGDHTNSVLYLIKGTVALSDDNGRTYDVDADTAKAKFPLSSGSKHTTTAIAKTPVSILRISQKIMSAKTAEPTPLSEILIPPELAENRILNAFNEHYLSEDLETPSLAEVALKLNKAIQQDISIQDAVKIIQLDPVISARLIEIANCPLYLTSVPAKTLFNAVNRIGLKATRNLVTSLSVQHVFKTQNHLIKKQLEKLWKYSLYVSTLSYVLADASGQADPDEALLAGLVAEIGVIPFLNFAADLPKDFFSEEEIQQALPHIKSPIGFKVLQNWDFSEEFLEVPVFSDNWYHIGTDTLSLTDIVILSKLHNRIGQNDQSDLPPITAIPAASKLSNFALSPEHSLNLLHEAKQQVNEALKAFYL